MPTAVCMNGVHDDPKEENERGDCKTEWDCVWVGTVRYEHGWAVCRSSYVAMTFKFYSASVVHMAECSCTDV